MFSSQLWSLFIVCLCLLVAADVDLWKTNDGKGDIKQFWQPGEKCVTLYSHSPLH